jgi:hypothetical protein
MSKYNVTLSYTAHLYFKEGVSASNDEAAIRKAQKRIDIILRSISASYDIQEDEIYVEKISDEEIIGGDIDSILGNVTNDKCIC